MKKRIWSDVKKNEFMEKLCLPSCLNFVLTFMPCLTGGKCAQPFHVSYVLQCILTFMPCALNLTGQRD